MARATTLATLAPGLALLFLAGCPEPAEDKQDSAGETGQVVDDTYVAPVDADGDGLTEADGDCNDEDSTVFIGQEETCDGIDNNCNGVVDEGMPDSDADGTADCQDAEDCDGIDNDGNGQTDEGFPDSDGDGRADCVGAEICDGLDNDGDGEVDEDFDGDGDGFTSCGDPADCDDSNAAVNPGAAERDGNEIDDNCDGTIDAASWAEGDLLITEVLYNPQAVIDPYGEWIELYNTTDHEVLANGLELVSTDGEVIQISSSTALVIGPGDYFILGLSEDETKNGDVEVDYVYSGALLDNEGDDLTLYGGGEMLDYLYWDGGATMPDAVGASLGVDPGFYGSDNTDYWCAAINTWGFDAAGDKGSPGGINEPCATWDHDGDGFNGLEGDCDDTNPDVYPGAYEGDEGVDNDCDGDAELAPVAEASASSSGYACDTIQLDGSSSYDSDGGTLSYAWELISAPAASSKTTSDLNTATSANPTFYPDEVGDYAFQLTVNDGGTNSFPVTVSVTVGTRPTNSAPVAYAGGDQTTSGSADCTPVNYGADGYDCDACASGTVTLDASSSSDADGDEMEYSWSVTSGSTYGSLTSSTGSSVTLQISSVPGSYPTAHEETVEVTVTATDCMGATSTDTVAVVYSCLGTP